jgi:hypothetical protein
MEERQIQIGKFNAHERPPDPIRQAFKKYQKLDPFLLRGACATSEDDDAGVKLIIDPQHVNLERLPENVTLDRWLPGQKEGDVGLKNAFDAFLDHREQNGVRNKPIGIDRQLATLDRISVLGHSKISGTARFYSK